MKKGVVFGLGFGVATVLSAGIMYASTLVNDVYLSPFKIKLNGNEYNAQMPVLNYQGRTYLALRELGEVTGNEIDFVDNTIIVNNNEYTSESDKQKILNILKDVDNDLVYFKVLKINYEGGKYNVEVEYNSPITISENELIKLKKERNITLNNEQYTYIDDTSINGFIQKDGAKYEIINYEDGYAFILSGTAGGYTCSINKKENMSFWADGNTVIYDAFEKQEYKLKDDKAKTWLNKSLDDTIIRLRYSEESDLSIYIDNK